MTLPTLLETLRQALGRTATTPPLPLPDLPPALVRPRLDPAPLAPTFAARATAAGAEVVTVTASALDETIRALAPASRSTRDLRTRHVAGTADTRAAIFALDATIAEADLAIAASGTLVFAAPELDHDDHLALMAAPLVIAIVAADRVVPTLADALGTLPPPPATRLLVTGPSKTADIEGILVTGVHGPERLVVMVVT